jgi:hypothetical protein
LALVLLPALGCGDRRADECGDNPFPEGFCVPFETSAASKASVAQKCSFVPFFCCDTCGGDAYCLDFCVEPNE